MATTPESPGGGVAMAIVRTGDTFRTLDAIGYNDPEGCSRQDGVVLLPLVGGPCVSQVVVVRFFRDVVVSATSGTRSAALPARTWASRDVSHPRLWERRDRDVPDS